MKHNDNSAIKPDFHAPHLKINMISGALYKNLLLFTIPLMLSNMMQLLFNTINTIIVGQFCGDNSLAAIGSTTSLINLLTNLFVGLSVGCNIMIARYFGARDFHSLQKCVSSTILLSFFSGVILLVVGMIFTRPILVLMGTPLEILPLSSTYLRIYFMGMPAIMAYNYGSSILRGLGDTRTPLLFLLISGLCNTLLDLLFISVFHLGVAGAATATIISEYLSAILIASALLKEKEAFHIDLHDLHWDFSIVLKILAIGFPTGIQSSLFSFTNVLIQSSVNSFGTLAMAGCSAADSIDAFIDAAMMGVATSGMNFVSQNYGAKQYSRIQKILFYSIINVVFSGFLLGGLVYLNGHTLLSIYCTSEDAITYGLIKLFMICLFDCICGIMDVLNGFLRGLGSATVPMLICLLCVCITRLIWIYLIFPNHRTITCLFVSYPVTWVITILVLMIYYYDIRRRKLQRIS